MTGSVEQVHRPLGALSSTARLLSPAAVAAGRVALDRDVGLRLGRLREVATDARRERHRPSRSRIRSVVLGASGRLHWADRASPPPPPPDGAVVSPLAMATCDLDRALGLGATPFPRPLHFGHECVAEVVSVGSDVTTVAPGDRVVLPFQISCGTCRACERGLTGNCRAVPPLSMYGFGVAGGAWGGTFAEQVAVPFADAMLVGLPAGVDPAAVASAGDTLSDAYRHIAPHLDRVRRDPDGPRIVLLGAVRRTSRFSASVPLYAGLIARALDPDIPVTVADVRPEVRTEAARLGLDAVDPGSLRGASAPLVVDCSADPRGTRLAIQTTAPDGLVSCAGSLHASVRVPATLMFGRNVTLTVARSHLRAALPDVLNLVATGRLDPAVVTSRVARFDDAPAALTDHLLSGATKTVLVRDDRAG